jgi:hypothetical protein
MTLAPSGISTGTALSSIAFSPFRALNPNV